jgi:hypothetical protein
MLRSKGEEICRMELYRGIGLEVPWTRGKARRQDEAHSNHPDQEEHISVGDIRWLRGCAGNHRICICGAAAVAGLYECGLGGDRGASGGTELPYPMYELGGGSHRAQSQAIAKREAKKRVRKTKKPSN